MSTQYNTIQPQKKNGTLSLVIRWVNVDSILSEIIQAQKDKYCTIPFKCGIKKSYLLEVVSKIL
jgi:hypothetical protein